MKLTGLLIALLVAATLALAGCGGNGNGDGDAVEPPTGTEQLPPADPGAGREAFVSGTQPACGDCHTLADAGTTGTIGVNLDQRQPSFEDVLNALNTGPGAMPSYADLDEATKEDIAAYVSSVAGLGG